MVWWFENAQPEESAAASLEELFSIGFILERIIRDWIEERYRSRKKACRGVIVWWFEYPGDDIYRLCPPTYQITIASFFIILDICVVGVRGPSMP